MERLNQLSTAVNSLKGLDFNLKPKQVRILDAIHDGFDVLAMLPTGYGKSICFQLSPSFLKQTTDKENIVVVIAPLNAILHDQMTSMQAKGLRPEMLPHRRENVIPSLFDTLSSEEEDADDRPRTRWPKKIVKADLNVLIAHPESFLNEDTLHLLRTKVYQKRVRAIVVDEAHLVHSW